MTVLVYFTPGVDFRTASTSRAASDVAWREDASGSCIWMYMYPWSSSGRKLEGSTFAKEAPRNANAGDCHQGHGTLPNQSAARDARTNCCRTQTCG